MLRLEMPHQYNLGNVPGAALFLYGNAMGVIGILANLMGASTFFAVFFSEVFPSVPYWLFMLLVISLYPFLMWLVYVFITPSVISFNNYQACKHENPIMDNLQMIKDKIGITEEYEKAWKSRR